MRYDNLIANKERCSNCGGTLCQGFTCVPADPSVDPETGYRDSDEFLCDECSPRESGPTVWDAYDEADRKLTMERED